MKHHPLYLCAALFAVVLFAGNCRKSELSFESGGGATITFAISGRVLDKDNVPVSQAKVTAGGRTTTTDVDGYFRLNNVSSPKEKAYVKVEKAGYFPGSRMFVATGQASVNFVRINLILKDVIETFDASAGGEAYFPGGSIKFNPNSIVDAGNNAYSGIVSVAAFFIDPSQPDFRSLMPGDLRGVNSANQEAGLQSFGMMAVELMGTGGQKLQLASGKKATMRFTIPTSLSAQAPATIPLWYFDESTGFWKEEGSATKQGNEYVGEVGHFSFWNCDAPFPLVNFQATIKDQNGAPVPNATVIIKKVSDGSSGMGITDSTGVVCGKIPANQSLEMKIYDRCHTVMHTQNIGPYSGNANLGTITVTVNPAALLSVSGTAVNCNSTAVTNGYVNIYLEGMNYRANINNGNFSLSIMRCNGNPVQAHVVAVDMGNSQQGTSTTINVTTGPVNAGQLTACGVSSTQFVSYTLNGNNYGFASPADSIYFFNQDSVPNNFNLLSAQTSNSNNDQISLRYDGNSTGSFPIRYLYILQGNKFYNNQSGTVNITQFGNVGDFVTGSFTATVSDSTNTYPVTGSFKARRQK